MDKKTIIGIVVGAVVLLIAVGLIVYFTAFNNNPGPIQWYYCPGRPNVGECQSCNQAGSNWSPPHPTEEQCNSVKQDGIDGPCVQWRPGYCKKNN